MLYLFNSFVNGRKLQVIIYQRGGEGEHTTNQRIQETQPDDKEFSEQIVSRFDLSVCANTMNLHSGHIMLHHPSDLISSSMHILSMFLQYNDPDRENSNNNGENVEFTVFLLRLRLDKVNFLLFFPFFVSRLFSFLVELTSIFILFILK